MKYKFLLTTLLAFAISAFAGNVKTDTCVPMKSVELKENMRKLWSDHVIWTRQYIVSTIASLPDASFAASRLLKNQEAIGAAIVPYYGKEAGATLTELLKNHIIIATKVVAAALQNSDQKLKEADKDWHQNADEIADFLSKANPNWPKLDLKSMLYTHLTLTTKEVKLRMAKDWKNDVTNFDNIYSQALKMADTLSNGIFKQFP